MPLPSGTTLRGNFLPLESTTPADKTYSTINFKMNGSFSNAKLDTSGGYFNQNITIQSTFAQQIAKAFNKKVVYGDNSEQMLFTIKEFSTDSSNTAYMTNGSSKYPSSIGGIFQRGYNGTTKSPLYGYDTGDGYFENVYTLDALALNSTFPSDVINKKAVFHVETNTTDTTIKLWLYDPNCFSGVNGVFHPIPDSRGLKDKWYMGLNALNLSDWDYITPWSSSAYSKLNAELVGRTLKISKTDNDITSYEEVLINSITSIKNDNKAGVGIGAISTGSEYFPVYVEVSVSRSQNGTTAIDTTTDELTVNYTNSGSTTTTKNTYYNAWIEVDERDRSPIAKATFQIEESAGTSQDTKWFNWSLPNFASGNCVFNPQDSSNYVSGSYVNTASYSNFKEIWQRVNREMRGSTYFSTDNAEQMILRHLNDIKFYSSNTGNSGNNGQWPYQMSAYWTRGANGTTATKQYGYRSGSGYYANLYNTTKETETVINSSLSGAILYNSTSNTTIDLNFVTNGTLYPGFVMEYDHLALRFNLDDPLTSKEMTGIKKSSAPDLASALLKLNTQFAGQIIKVYSPQYDTTEDILINSVTNITVSNDTQIAPNDSGKYIPDKITLSVSRAQNGTTANITNSNQVNITNSGGSSGTYSIVNAYVTQNNNEYDEYLSESIKTGSSVSQLALFKENFNQTISNSNEVIISGSFIQAVSEVLEIDNSLLDFGNVKVFVEEKMIFSDAMIDMTIKEFIIMVNDMIGLSSNSSNKTEYLNLISDSIRVFDQSNLLDFVDYYANLQEYLKVGSNVSLDTANAIITVIVNEYFRILANNTTSFVQYTERVIDFFINKNQVNLSGDILIQISDGFKLAQNLGSSMDMKVIVEELFKSTFVVQINGETYECYALNLDNKALTRYTNYNFNSYTHFNGNYYALGKDGLYNLVDTSEDGEVLESKVKTSFLNISDSGFNVLGGLGSLQKSLNNGYFVIKNDGQVGLRVYTDLGKSFDYILKQDYNDSKFRASFGKAVQGTCFQLELTFFDDFELEQCEFIPIIGSKKI